MVKGTDMRPVSAQNTPADPEQHKGSCEKKEIRERRNLRKGRNDFLVSVPVFCFLRRQCSWEMRSDFFTNFPVLELLQGTLPHQQYGF